MKSIFSFIENYYLIMVFIELIISIILLIMATKKDKKEHWTFLFTLEILTIFVTFITYNAYSNKILYTDFTGLAIAMCYALGTITNLLLLFISYCIKIIKYEKNNKKTNQKYMNPIVLISSVTLIIIGCIFLSDEIVNNWGYRGSINANVTNVLGGSHGHFADVKYSINGKEYESIYINLDLSMKKGDIIKTSYYYNDSKYKLHDYYNSKQYYLPLFITGILLIAYRFKKNNTNN